jgi:hypothetical protein
MTLESVFESVLLIKMINNSNVNACERRTT